MSKDEVEFIDKLRGLSISAAYELLNGVDRLKALSEELAGENQADSKVGNAQQRVKGLVYQLARTELEHAENILKIGNSQADLLFEHAQRIVRSIGGGGQVPAPVIELCVTLAAPEVGHATFALHNPFSRRADVRLEIEPFKDHHGRHVSLLDAAVAPQCKSAPVAARSRAEVDLTVTLPQGITPGLYFSKITAYLSADIERRVAVRMLKLRVS